MLECHGESGKARLAGGPLKEIRVWILFPPLVSFVGLSTAELCRPMLVCPLQRPEGVRGMECFLRVTSAHVVEVELQAARTLGRLELQSLVTAELEPESATRTEPVSEVNGGVGVRAGSGRGAGG